MNKSLSMLITALLVMFSFQSQAATTYSSPSLDSLSNPMVCAEEDKKKKTDGEEEEPECE